MILVVEATDRYADCPPTGIERETAPSKFRSERLANDIQDIVRRPDCPRFHPITVDLRLYPVAIRGSAINDGYSNGLRLGKG